jgi:precorrin-6B methylase 2
MERFHIKRINLFWKTVDWLACKVNKLAKIYDMTVGNEYRRERKKFALSNAKRVLHIGCGSYPITAMVLAEMDGVNVVTIDNDIRAVKRANQVINKNNLNGKIRAEHGNGIKYPLDEFDTIIVSGCSVPKIKVFERVLKDAKSKSNIIIRDSITDVEAIINNLNPYQDIKIVEKMENHLFPNSRWDSFHIIKE